MARFVNIYDAKTQLSALVEAAAAGEEIVIARAGKPRAKLAPIRSAVRRRPGRTKGTTVLADDFDAPLPEALIRAFEGQG